MSSSRCFVRCCRNPCSKHAHNACMSPHRQMILPGGLQSEKGLQGVKSTALSRTVSTRTFGTTMADSTFLWTARIQWCEHMNYFKMMRSSLHCCKHGFGSDSRSVTELGHLYISALVLMSSDRVENDPQPGPERAACGQCNSLC